MCVNPLRYDWDMIEIWSKYHFCDICQSHDHQRRTPSVAVLGRPLCTSAARLCKQEIDPPFIQIHWDMIEIWIKYHLYDICQSHDHPRCTPSVAVLGRPLCTSTARLCKQKIDPPFTQIRWDLSKIWSKYHCCNICQSHDHQRCTPSVAVLGRPLCTSTARLCKQKIDPPFTQIRWDMIEIWIKYHFCNICQSHDHQRCTPSVAVLGRPLCTSAPRLCKQQIDPLFIQIHWDLSKIWSKYFIPTLLCTLFGRLSTLYYAKLATQNQQQQALWYTFGTLISRNFA
jgi:hypothetical protein